MTTPLAFPVAKQHMPDNDENSQNEQRVLDAVKIQDLIYFKEAIVIDGLYSAIWDRY